jgi:hypothetical protein
MKVAMKVAMKKLPPGYGMLRGAPVLLPKAAAPARGGKVMKLAMKAAPKAIAAKSFAHMAKLSRKASFEQSPPGEGVWYYMSDLRKMKVGKDDDKAWSKFTPKMSKQLETAYTKKFAQYTMKLGDRTYIVKFKTMMQFRADDKSLQRPVKRV